MFVSCLTNCAARFVPIALPGDRTVGMLVVKRTYEIDDDQLSAALKQWPVFASDEQVEGRSYESDLMLPKEKVDLVVVGDAVAPHNKPVSSLDVRIALGSVDRTLHVSGDRFWMSKETADAPRGAIRSKSLSELMALRDRMRELNPPELSLSPPAPPEPKDESDEQQNEMDAIEEKDYYISPPAKFKQLPLVWNYAYGGESPDGTIFPDNPEGKGFVLPSVDDKQPPAVPWAPLPNIESKGNPITSWKQRPTPAGCAFYPMTWGLRLAAGIDQASVSTSDPPAILPAFFNQAHPDFQMDDFPDGRELLITNMNAHYPEIRVSIRRPRLRAHIVLADNETQDLPITWDLVCVRPSQMQLYVTGRALFRFIPDRMSGRRILVESTADSN